MNEWISQIRSAMTSIRDGRGASSPTPAPRRSRTQTGEPARAPTSAGQPEAASSTPKPRPKTLDVDDVQPTEQLECVTRQRAKGPTGRRLPRRVAPIATAEETGPRSESLPRLEADRETKAARQSRYHHQHNRSFDFSQQRAPRASTLYAYSSSEESLSLPFAPNLDEETVETLCEIHHSTSTPSLVDRQWTKAASKSDNSNGKRRSTYLPSSDSTSADDPPDLPQQCQLLLHQTAAMKTTLAGLEAEFGASRRDLGWLQENLTSVRTAAGTVSEKVAKMQSQVATMERQIAGAVKEAQTMQQKASEALKSAADAERDFRRLEAECRALLGQMVRRHFESGSDALCLSPMTPPQVPAAFDFAAMFAKCDAPLKSSIKQNGDVAAVTRAVKSISFGPITTFTPGDESDEPLSPMSPVATSTLNRQGGIATSLIAS